MGLAYLLDPELVPETHLVTVDGKKGSLQKFVAGCESSWGDFGPSTWIQKDAQRIAAFDIRIANGDRSEGNALLLKKKVNKSETTANIIIPEAARLKISLPSSFRVIPIDHAQ